MEGQFVSALSIDPVQLCLALALVTLWHELGHCLAARSVGVPVRVLSVGFGPVLWRRTMWDDSVLQLRVLPLGMSIMVPVRYSSKGTDLRPVVHDEWIAAAGPMASFALTIILFGLARFLPLPSQLAHGLVGVGLLSTVVALLNLLPLPGLDGGHLFLLATRRLGGQLTPEQEMRLHRTGLQLLTLACLIPLGIVLLGWLR